LFLSAAAGPGRGSPARWPADLQHHQRAAYKAGGTAAHSAGAGGITHRDGWDGRAVQLLL